MSGADTLRRLFCVAALLYALPASAASQSGLFSSAEEFLAHDWRGEGRSGLSVSANSRGVARALPMSIGTLPVPGRFLKAETTPFDRIPHIMGPGKESSPTWPLAEGFTGRCYGSNRDGDETALLFLWGTNDMAQCIAVFKSRAQLAPSVDCAPSDHVNAGMRTPEGLRLGMPRAEVEALLGAPDGSSTDRIGYSRRFKLLATKRLLHELGRKHVPGVETILRYQQVMLWFQGGRVVGFSVEQHSHYD